jgi:signal transduction histidine kinase
MSTLRLAGKRILMVDDSRAVRVYLHVVLSGQGAEVEAAPSGEAALAVVEAAARQAGLKGQTLYLDLPRHPVHARVDADRLGQVLDNLVSNAVKYSPEGGWITLSLAVEDGCAVFRVKDTGVGIDPEQFPRLFARYQRLPGEGTRGIRGTGLGLVIVKEIAEAHGGSVAAELAGAEKGSTFTVRIPLQPPEEEAAPQVVGAAAAREG